MLSGSYFRHAGPLKGPNLKLLRSILPSMLAIVLLHTPTLQALESPHNETPRLVPEARVISIPRQALDKSLLEFAKIANVQFAW